MVAAEDDRVGAVAAEGAYTSLSDTFTTHLRPLYRFSAGLAAWMLSSAYRLRFGIWASDVSPLAAMPRLAPRPVLLIQGTMDTRTPVDSTNRLHAAAREPRELWIIRGAGHQDAFFSDPETYARKLAEFFRKALPA
jgi:pimeloyl-ACP methyl ester carboxylesterase